jgi:hypothetical protein
MTLVIHQYDFDWAQPAPELADTDTGFLYWSGIFTVKVLPLPYSLEKEISPFNNST